MGMEACVTGFGPYKKKLARYLDYPEDWYEDTNDGSLVAATFFTCNTSDQSRELATALGIEPWDFNKHFINSYDNVAENLLYELEESCGEWDTEDIVGFRACFEAGFTLLFMPNG